jgi:hypothetical protein
LRSARGPTGQPHQPAANYVGALQGLDCCSAPTAFDFDHVGACEAASFWKRSGKVSKFEKVQKLILSEEHGKVIEKKPLVARIVNDEKICGENKARNAVKLLISDGYLEEFDKQRTTGPAEIWVRRTDKKTEPRVICWVASRSPRAFGPDCEIRLLVGLRSFTDC